MDVVLDMDGTLIDDYEHGMEGIEPIHLGVVHGRADSIIPRPHMPKLIKFCKENFNNLYLCSFSSNYRVDRCLKSLGIDHHFTKIFGGNDVENADGCFLDLNRKFVLVDDYPTDTELIRRKLDFFGISWNSTDHSKYHIRVKEFNGSHSDRELLNIIKKLKVSLKKNI